jgi:hypothetical protein
MFRVGDGLSETVAREVGSDVQWFALNLGDGQTWDRYSTLREIAKENDVLCMPWARVYDPDEVFALLYQAEQVGFHCLLNIENEFQTDLPPMTVRDLIDEFSALQVGISTVGWVYNDIDLECLADVPFLLQIFPTEFRPPWPVDEIPQKETDCIRHARELGAVYVGTTIQTYGGAEPSWFAYQDHVRSYYTGDDIGQGGWTDWKP